MLINHKPTGGTPLKFPGRIAWGESRKRFMHKLGYCESCSATIYASREQLKEIMKHASLQQSGWTVKRKIEQKIGDFILRRLSHY